MSSLGIYYIHLCHKSKREIGIVKLDFEKSFDRVEYSAMLLMLKHMGFGDKWIAWIKYILYSSWIKNNLHKRSEAG
jgi:hypothetical protein